MLAFVNLMTLYVMVHTTEEKCFFRTTNMNCKNFNEEQKIDSFNFQNSTVCRKNFTISLVNIEPYSSGLLHLFKKKVLQPCCGKLVQHHVLFNYTTTTDFLNAAACPNATKTDFVLPVIAPKSTTKIYGYKYHPIILTPSGVYVTLQPTSEKMLSVLTTCLQLWPLLIVCIAMAFIAGFINWLLDTWPNSEQFPRSFVPGVFEGFWWSFVSMTTVGYGDKSPLGWPARLFAVVWILIGITICSLLTASLTSALTAQRIPPDMNSKNVGILANRLYEKLFVLKKKGNPIEVKGITELFYKLKSGKINGIFLDRFAWPFYLKSNINDYETTVYFYDGEPLSYGLLVSDRLVNKFFHDFMVDHYMVFDLCSEEVFQNLISVQIRQSVLFNSKSGLFYGALYTCGFIIVLIAVFGLFYEIVRKRLEMRDGRGANEGELIEKEISKRL